MSKLGVRNSPLSFASAVPATLRTPASVRCDRLEHLQQQLSTRVEAGGEGGGRGGPPNSARVEEGRWGRTRVVGSEGGQGCGDEQKKRQEAPPGGVALATLACPQVRVARSGRRRAERRCFSLFLLFCFAWGFAWTSHREREVLGFPAPS